MNNLIIFKTKKRFGGCEKRCLIILIFACAYIQTKAQVGFISTIAGKANCLDVGDGGPALNANLQAPARICTDRAGNIIIADAANNRIRNISPLGQRIITTVAGTGAWGSTGDGGPATNATLDGPQAVTTDTAGNIYICDGFNNTVRKVTISSGVISLVAGSGVMGDFGDGHLATQAALNQPAGICIDKSGNILIADWGNDKIRKVDISTGRIHTIAGTGVEGYNGDARAATTAQLNGPLQVMTDKDGNILIAEQYNHRIRKVDVNGIITTIAGTGVQGYSGEGVLAVNAQLNQPAGIFVDNHNSIYIAEYGNGTIRKIDASTHKIYTVAGTGITGFDGDEPRLATSTKLFCTDMFIDNYGNLVIGDYENNRIRMVSSATKVNDLHNFDANALYPNPTNGKFVIQTSSHESIVTIFNTSGKLMYSANASNSKIDIDITQQPPGIYVVYVQCGEETYAGKVVVTAQ